MMTIETIQRLIGQSAIALSVVLFIGTLVSHWHIDQARCLGLAQTQQQIEGCNSAAMVPTLIELIHENEE